MKDILKILLFPLGLFGILFGSAGRWDLPFFWAMMVIFMIQVVVGLWVMHPDLRKERVRPAPGGIDRHLRWMVMPFFLGHWVIAGLDVGRFHWSDTVPPVVQIGGLVGMALTMGGQREPVLLAGRSHPRGARPSLGHGWPVSIHPAPRLSRWHEHGAL